MLTWFSMSLACGPSTFWNRAPEHVPTFWNNYCLDFAIHQSTLGDRKPAPALAVTGMFFTSWHGLCGGNGACVKQRAQEPHRNTGDVADWA